MASSGTVFLLEDNPQRLDRMFGVLRDLLPDRDIRVEDDCTKAIAWLRDNQALVDLISLDHDLDSVPRDEDPSVDHGCGRPVADFLATQPPTCPIIIHTSNAIAGDGMYHELRRAKWPVFRVYPHDHHDWVPVDWAKTIRDLQAASWLR
jgi:hypothetical protein